MTTATIEQEPAPSLITTPRPVSFALPDAAIAEITREYMALTIKGVDDREGFAAVREARMDVKALRVDVEKKRKELKAEALEYGRTVDGEAKRITALLTPVELYLESQESVITAEKERLKQIEIDRKKAALESRLKQLADCGGVLEHPGTIEAMDAETFGLYLAKQQREFAAKQEEEAREKARREAEDSVRRAEAELLARERAELDKIRKEQADERAKIEAEKLALTRAAEMEKVRADAAAQASSQAEARFAREKAAAQDRQERAIAEAKQKIEAEEMARLLEQAAQPDRERLLSVAIVVAGISVPVVASPEANAAREKIARLLAAVADKVREIVAAV